VKLELRGITKAFGPLVANDHIDLTVEPGQIHALLGENGAGKSTLMNVLYGLHQPDAGEILIDDEPVTFSGPGDAVAAGIGMVHQHFMLVPVFTVAESVALGYEPAGPLGILNAGAAAAKVTEISRRFGFDVDPDALVEDLPVGVQQRVEIIKALARDAKVLILDEPTAVLTPQETDELITIMRELKASGTSIVFITHKLREIREVADTITVIRRGRVVGTAEPPAAETRRRNANTAATPKPAPQERVRTAEKPAAERTRMAEKPAAERNRPAPAQTYKVAQGDTVYSIAKRYNISTDELIAANQIRNNRLSVGQTLKVSGNAAANVQAARNGNAPRGNSAAKPAEQNTRHGNQRDANKANAQPAHNGRSGKPDAPTTRNNDRTEKTGAPATRNGSQRNQQTEKHHAPNTRNADRQAEKPNAQPARNSQRGNSGQSKPAQPAKRR